MALVPEQSLNRLRFLNKLQKLAAELDPGWLAVVSHPKLEACRVSFQFECPQQWEKLTPTGTDTMRFCENCKRSVHYCDTLQEARDHAAAGHCVAITLALVRRPDDLFRPPRTGVVGGIALTPAMIVRLGTPSRIGNSTRADPEPLPEWVPQTPGRRPRRKRRKK